MLASSVLVCTGQEVCWLGESQDALFLRCCDGQAAAGMVWAWGFLACAGPGTLLWQRCWGPEGPQFGLSCFALHWCWYGGTVRSHVGAFGHEQGDPLGGHLELVWASILCSNLSVLSVWGANINNGAYQHLSSWREF